MESINPVCYNYLCGRILIRKEGMTLKKKKRTALYLVLLTFVIFALLMGLLYFIHVRINQDNAYQASALLIDQVKHVVEENDDKVRSLTASLKDDYVTRAKAISYIIDNQPKIENRITELAWLTNLFSIDEIHLFNPDGKLYSGTKPAFYGDNLKTSKTFGPFAKMLTEKNFTMCQSILEDNYTGKQMMYAVCWNDAHKRLVMVGVEPMRLMNELATAQMDAVIKEFPAYEGVEIIVADDKTDKILGATTQTLIGKTLKDANVLYDGDIKLNEISTGSELIHDQVYYCSYTRYDMYKVIIAQNRGVVQKNIPIPLILVGVYMLFAGAVILLIVRRMTSRIINEHNKANSDAMTSFSNRRAYENDIKRYDEKGYEPNLSYVSLDLNGLKRVNDSLGHEAGDKLIIGAASVIHQCFGNYGEMYRIGGDEFAALIYADLDRLTKIKMDFKEAMDEWSKENGMTLSISYGIVRACEDPNMSFSEMAKLADVRMYKNKDEYYQKMNLVRRN